MHRNAIHGHNSRGKPSPTYISWMDMMQRCRDPKVKDWSRYGGRGIYVCKRWHLFINFLADMGERPAGTTLDRIKSGRGYWKSNCRWATRKEQNDNRRSNVYLTLNGRRMSLPAWAAELGMSSNTLHRRIKQYGWTIERALTTPVRPISIKD